MSELGGAPALDPADRAVLGELAPVLRRAIDLDRRAIARLRLGAGVATVLVRLPFGVLASRSVSAPGAAGPESEPGPAAPEGVPDAPASQGEPDGQRAVLRDVSVAAAEALAWLDDPAAAPLAARDALWRGGLPPAHGWRRIESVPDEVVRSLVRSGALALRQAAEREGVPGAQPRGEVADALLDSVVLTVTDEHDGGAARASVTAEVTLRTISALTRMGFVARGSEVHVDLAGRWLRVVGRFGTVYSERGTSLLSVQGR